jgi:outer membrane protein assembly factor BamB
VVNPSSGAEWPGWRGPAGDGTSPEKDLPERWSATDNVRWKVPLFGAGVSTPVVWGERIFLTASDGRLNDRLHVLCYHRADGRLLWHRKLFGSSVPEGQFPPGGMAVPSPTTDGKHVYALFGTGDLVCLDLDGKPVWVRSLAQEHGPFRNRWGMAASPLLLADRLVVQVDHWGQSYLLAVDAATGSDRWRTERDAAVNWTSPVAATVNGKVQVIAAGTYRVKGYDAEKGNELWSVTGMQQQCIPTPVVQGDLLLAVSGRDFYTLAVRLDGRLGDLTKTHVAWKARSRGAYIPSPVCLGDRYYFVEDNGWGNCLETATGKEIWRERLGGNYRASPVAGDGKIYFTSLEGVVTVVKAGAEFDVVARNDVGEALTASPAISAGQIFLRGEKHLFCVGGK